MALENPHTALFGVGQHPEIFFFHTAEDVFGNVFSSDVGAFHQFVDVLLYAGNIRAHGAGQVGLEKRRAHAADVNTGIPQLLAEGFGEGNHAGLGDVVAVHQGRQHEAGHGGDVNEGAGTLLLELRRKRLTATDHAQNVDIKNPFPVTNGGVFNGACGGNASVVDHNIYPTPLLDQIVPDFLEIAQSTNIAFHKIAFATGPVQFRL